MSKRHSTSLPARFSIVGDHVRRLVIALVTAVFAVLLAGACVPASATGVYLAPRMTCPHPPMTVPRTGCRLAAAQRAGVEVPFEVVESSTVIGPGPWNSIDDILRDAASVGADRIR